MDKQNNFHQESLLLQLPMEMLVYIISFLSSLRDKIKLQYVSKWLKDAIEGTPSLWKEFVLPHCDSKEENSVMEILRVCGKHVKILSFPQCKLLPSIIVEMLQCCNNVQHLDLSSTILDPDQVRKIIDNMQYLQTLELMIGIEGDFKKMLRSTCQLKHLRLFTDPTTVFIHWNELEIKPASLEVVKPFLHDGRNDYSFRLANYISYLQLYTGTTTVNFRMYDAESKVPFNFSPRFPYLQFELEGSGQVTAPFVKLSDCGIVGMQYDVAMVTDYQYSGRTMHMVRFVRNTCIVTLNSMLIPKQCNLGCATHFDLDCCQSLYAGHLEQLAIACPNLERLNLQYTCCCLKSLQGLQAIASHCRNLQGLNLLHIPVSNVENLVLLWKILSNMKLTHLALDICYLIPEASMEEKLICLYQKCWTIRGIQLNICHHEKFADKNELMLCYFPSLQYCYILFEHTLPIVIQDVIYNCNKLEIFTFIGDIILLKLAHIYNLQQFCIDSIDTDVPDDFMTSVSAHGGLVHVIMKVRSLTGKGITLLVRNSPKLLTLHLCVTRAVHHTDGTMESFNLTLKKLFCFRKLFTGGHYMYEFRKNRFVSEVVHEQETDLLPLWHDVRLCDR